MAIFETVFGAAFVEEFYRPIREGRGPQTDDADVDRFRDEAITVAALAVESMERLSKPATPEST